MSDTRSTVASVLQSSTTMISRLLQLCASRLRRAVSINASALNAGMITLIFGCASCEMRGTHSTCRLSRLSGALGLRRVTGIKSAAARARLSQIRRNAGSGSSCPRPVGRHVLAAARHRSACRPWRSIASCTHSLARAWRSLRSSTSALSKAGPRCPRYGGSFSVRQAMKGRALGHSEALAYQRASAQEA